MQTGRTISRGIWALGWLVCVSACGDSGQAPATCGDGLVDPSTEECDIGVANGATGFCCTAECQFADSATTCREGSGDACDAAEVCSGDAAECPEDTFADSSTVCRESRGECDLEELCPGTGDPCPEDITVEDGTACSGNGESECSSADTCQAGLCEDNDAEAGTPCSGEPTCDPDVCDGAGVCEDNAPVVDGELCEDNGGNTCCSAACTLQAVAGTCDPCVNADRGPQTVTIIESQSSSAGQNMDDQWKLQAEAMGHTATIVPQSTLNSIDNLSGTDILIVASHDIAVPPAGRSTITAFAGSGKGVYIQGEFQATFEGNQVFEQVVDSFGAGFTWGPEVTGLLDLSTTGCFGSFPNTVPTISQNFAVSGSAVGGGLGPFQFSMTTPVSFAYCISGGGLVVTMTDKDQIRSSPAGVPELMQNILYRLTYPDLCPF